MPSSSVSSRASVTAAGGDAARGLRTSWCAFHCQFLGGLPVVAAQFSDQRDHARVDAGHQRIGFLPLVVAHQHPAGAAVDIGHFCSPLVEDQIEVPAEGIC
jgi:hypothetical protein